MTFDANGYGISNANIIKTPFTDIQSTLLYGFTSFAKQHFLVSVYSDFPLTLSIEAPCTLYTPSTFTYSLAPNPPEWITYSSNIFTSTQYLILSKADLGQNNVFIYTGSLSNWELENNEVKYAHFEITVFKCADPACIEC